MTGPILRIEPERNLWELTGNLRVLLCHCLSPAFFELYCKEQVRQRLCKAESVTYQHLFQRSDPVGGERIFLRALMWAFERVGGGVEGGVADFARVGIGVAEQCLQHAVSLAG